jgi:membrane protease YdiL (CAAX protease family)
MDRFLGFIRRERLYLLILLFILTVNVIALIPMRPAAQAHRDAKEPVSVTGPVAVGRIGEPAEDIEAERRAQLDRKFRENRHLAVIFGLTSLLMMAVLLLGIALDLIIIGSRVAGRPIDICTYRMAPVKWGAWDVAKVMMLFIFFGYIFIMIESVLARVFPVIKDDNFRMILNSSVLDTLGVVFIIYFTVAQHGERLAALGLSLRHFFRNVFYGIAAYIALIPALVLVLAGTAFFVSMIKYVPPKQPVVELFLKETNAPLLFYTSIFAAVFGPIIEELFFRGFMYNAFKARLGVLGSMIVTAALFAALHSHAVGFLPIMVLGMLLAYIYEKTGTLVASITVHMAHNLAMVFLVFLVKQLGVL